MKILRSTNKQFLYKIYNDDDDFLGGVPKQLIIKSGVLPVDDLTFFDKQCRTYQLEIESEDTEIFFADVAEWVRENATTRLLEYLSTAERTQFDCRLFLKKNEVPLEIIENLLKKVLSKVLSSLLRILVNVKICL